MLNFTFYSPTYFVFGKEEENNTGKYVKRFGGNKVLIHYGGGSVVRSGLLDRVKKSLELENIQYVELGGVKPNPRSGLVYEGIELCRKENIDFVNEHIEQEITNPCLKDRLDLREHLIVTIDGDNARDFDDAIEVYKNDDGFVTDIDSNMRDNLSPDTVCVK